MSASTEAVQLLGFLFASDLVLYLDYCFLTFALQSSYYFPGITPATSGTLLIHFKITYIKQMKVFLSST